LDVAEQLFGDHGVANVSLRQIRLAADQRNAAAVQYHFGDRDGVVRALADRHTPRLLAIQAEFVAGIDRGRGGSARFRRLVEAFVRPYAEYVALGAGERAWIKILDDVVTNPKVSLQSLSEQSDTQAVLVGEALYEELSRTLPPEVASERVWFVATSGLHLCAAWARVRDDPLAERALSSDEAFTQNLVDMSAGALSAPSRPLSARRGVASTAGT
jgi:AcrR family transcriptional regulator